MSATVEIATAADAPDLAALHYLSHTTAFAAFASPDWVASRKLASYQETWRKNMAVADARARTWVAREDDNVVGMVRIMPMPEDGLAQLTSMHVHPAYQGRGIGTRLMQVSEAFIRDVGYRRAILGVIEANVRAKALYEKAGWVAIEHRPHGVEGVPTAIYGKRYGGSPGGRLAAT